MHAWIRGSEAYEWIVILNLVKDSIAIHSFPFVSLSFSFYAFEEKRDWGGGGRGGGVETELSKLSCVYRLEIK